MLKYCDIFTLSIVCKTANTQALQDVSKKHRRTSVAVFFKSTKQSRIGKSYLTDEAVNISFQDIFSVCEFEVSNAYFSLNCVIFLQLLGCPQGGPGSCVHAKIHAFCSTILILHTFFVHILVVICSKQWNAYYFNYIFQNLCLKLYF